MRWHQPPEGLTATEKVMVPVEIDVMGTTQTFLATKEDAERINEGRKNYTTEVAKRRAACMQARKLYRDRPTAEHRAAFIMAIKLRAGACNSHERAGIMLPLITWEPAEIFWPVFVDTWPACDLAAAWSGAILAAMRRHRPATQYLAPEIREVTDALPDLIEVWRGADCTGVRRFSWTTNPEKAEFFAVHRRGAPFPNPVIAHAFIPKAHVFYASDGGEAEILLDPRRLRKLSIRCVAHIVPGQPEAKKEED
jgi:hypothetical protein